MDKNAKQADDLFDHLEAQGAADRMANPLVVSEKVTHLLANTLKQVTQRLGCYIEAHGMLNERDDETLAMAGIAHAAAKGTIEI